MKVYIGTDNTIELQLISGRNPANLDDVTKIVIKIGEVEIDSSSPENTTNGYITWTSGVPTFNQGNLILKLGNHPDLIDFNGIHEMRLTSFDFYYPNGLVWVNEYKIEFIQ